jgi:ribokinase
MTVIVVGSINMDIVLTVDHFPEPGETISATGLNYFPGGKGANQAVAIARLGHKAMLIGRVGSDAYGPVLLDGLQKDNVITTHTLPLEESSSGVALITVDRTGENSIVVYAGANARLQPADVAACFNQLERDASVFLTQLEVPLDTVLRSITLAKERGLKTVFNPAPSRALEEVRLILGKTDVLVLNETETQTLTGIALESDQDAFDAADWLLGLGPEAIVITLGAAGSILVDKEQHVHLPAPDVEAVDTTAAGDAFIGGLCVSLLEGRSRAEAVRFANCAGAIAVTRHGAQPSLPTYEDVMQASLASHESLAMARRA